jgi:hypothetical protein
VKTAKSLLVVISHSLLVSRHCSSLDVCRSSVLLLTESTKDGEESIGKLKKEKINQKKASRTDLRARGST